MSLCVYLCVSVCLCVYTRGEEGEREKRGILLHLLGFSLMSRNKPSGNIPSMIYSPFLSCRACSIYLPGVDFKHTTINNRKRSYMSCLPARPSALPAGELTQCTPLM